MRSTQTKESSKSTYGYYSIIQAEFQQERKNPSSAQDFFASPIKEKRLGRFSTPDFINQFRAVRRIFSPPDLQSKSEQCATCNEREARSSPRRNYARLLSQSAHKRRALCPHKELQSAFISFIASERMRYKSLRTDKRKTARPFFASRLKRAILKRSAYYRIFTAQKTELFKSL